MSDGLSVSRALRAELRMGIASARSASHSSLIAFAPMACSLATACIMMRCADGDAGGEGVVRRKREKRADMVGVAVELREGIQSMGSGHVKRVSGF